MPFRYAMSLANIVKPPLTQALPVAYDNEDARPMTRAKTKALTRATQVNSAQAVSKPTPKWLGDPGDGNYYLGWALEEGTVSGMGMSERLTWPGYPGDAYVSVIHDYSGNTQGVDIARLNKIIAAGMIPSQSVKFQAFTWAGIKNGTHDAAITSNALQVKALAPWPVIICMHHEPGGDFGTAATNDPNAGSTTAMKDYRDGMRRVVQLYRDAGVTNVNWTCILETPWNFAGPSVGGSPSWMDFRMWHADWDWRNGVWFDDVMMDIFGFDVYVPMIGGGSYRQLATDIGFIQTDLAASGAPDWDFGIFEWGMNNDAKLHDWVDYCTKAVTTLKNNRVKFITYWDNSDDLGRYTMGPRPGNWDGDVSDWDHDGTKRAGYAILRDGATKWGGV